MIDSRFILFVLFGLLAAVAFFLGEHLILFLLLGACLLLVLNTAHRDFAVILLLLSTPVERRIPFLPYDYWQIIFLKYIFILFLVIIWFLREKEICFPLKDRKYILLWLVSFFMLIVITTVNAMYIQVSLKGLLPLITGFLSFLLFYNYLQDRKNILKVFLGFLVITGGLSLVVILQYLVIEFGILTSLEKYILSPTVRLLVRMKYMQSVTTPVRVNGTFVHPNLLGQYLLFMFFMVTPMLLWKSKRKWIKALIVFVVLLCLAAIFCTNSRSVILGCIVGMTFVLFIARKKIFYSGAIIGLCLTVIVLVSGFQRDRIDHYFRVHQGISYRGEIWSQAFHFYLERPLLGYGLDAYPYLYYYFAGAPLGNDYNQFIYDLVSIRRMGYIPDGLVSWANPHNAYLTMLLDMGSLGLIFMLTFLFYILKKSITLLKHFKYQEEPFYYCAAMSCSGIIVSMIWRGFFDFSGFYKLCFESVIYSFVISLLFVLEEEGSRRREIIT